MALPRPENFEDLGYQPYLWIMFKETWNDKENSNFARGKRKRIRVDSSCLRTFSTHRLGQPHVVCKARSTEYIALPCLLRSLLLVHGIHHSFNKVIVDGLAVLYASRFK